jgi:sortase A
MSRRQPRIASGVRPLEAVLFTIGAVFLAWYGFVAVEAAIYQRVKGAELNRAPVAARALARGSAIGRLEIPRLTMTSVVVEGDDDATLKVAVGHLPDTPLPWQPGNAAFAGHRDTFFRALRRVEHGDEIRLVTPRGTFRYRVDDRMIVEPHHVSVLKATKRPVLTLITCYPFTYTGNAPQRFVVRATRQ